MAEVTDKDLLAQLNSSDVPSEVTDPSVLAMLNASQNGAASTTGAIKGVPQGEGKKPFFQRGEGRSIGQTLAGQAASASQGATLGWSDELLRKTLPAAGGFVRSAGEYVPSFIQPSFENVAGRLEVAPSVIEEQLRYQELRNPTLTASTEIGGGILGTMGAGGALAKLGTTYTPRVASALQKFAAANPSKAGGAVAALEGGLYSAGKADGTALERVDDFIKGATISGPFGAILGRAFGRGGGAGGTGTGGTGAADDAVSTALETRISATNTPLNDAQEANRQLLESVGVKNPTLGMITRDPSVWQFERNTAGIQGTGDVIRDRYLAANGALKESLNKIGKSIPSTAATPYEAGVSVVEAVTRKSKEMQDDIGKLYSSIRETKGNNLGLMPNKLLSAIDEYAPDAIGAGDWKGGDAIISKLKKMNVIDANGNVTNAVTVSDAENIRKFIGGLSAKEPAQKRIQSAFINAFDDDVIETSGEDAFIRARNAARDRFSEFAQPALKKISEGKLVEDDIINKGVLGAKVKDLIALKKTLLSGEEGQVRRGVDAWNDVKLQVSQKIIDNSVGSNGKLSGTALERELDKIGKERLSHIFSPEDLVQWNAVKNAAKLVTVDVPESFVNYSNTASALSNIVRGSKVGEILTKGSRAVSNVPFVGALTSPVTAVARMAGEGLQKSAQESAIQSVVKPFVKQASPYGVAKGGALGGLAYEAGLPVAGSALGQLYDRLNRE